MRRGLPRAQWAVEVLVVPGCPQQHPTTERHPEHPEGAEHEVPVSRGVSTQDRARHHHRDRGPLPSEGGPLVLHPRVEDRRWTGLLAHRESTIRRTTATMPITATPVAMICGRGEGGSGSSSLMERSLSAQRR